MGELSLEQDPKAVLERAALIMDSFCAEVPARNLSSLVKATNLPRSTVHRLAEQLVKVGWLERMPYGYRVGTRLFEVGTRAGRYERLMARSGPWLQELLRTTQRSVHLGVLDGADVVYLVKLAMRNSQVPTRPGGRKPAHSTGLGKAMLAFSPDVHLDAVLERGLTRYTPRTISNEESLRQVLATIQETEVAYDFEETVPGVYCVAAPVRGSGNAIAAVSVTGPREGFDVNVLSRAVKNAAHGIWNDLFGPGRVYGYGMGPTVDDGSHSLTAAS
ncbi:MAG TPA: IclR family transcriptional regulator [Acidimicrobiales bacterium]|nr:IclR family transcriptional regulator [Acidimicrobiales bacterium]